LAWSGHAGFRMSVEINYISNHGNNLFQYVCGRLFADRLGVELTTAFNRPELVMMSPHRPGRVIRRPATILTDRHPVLSRRWPQGHYVLQGYFQRSEWYHQCRDAIREFASVREVPQRSSSDIVINLRLGEDYRKLNWCIHPRWYLRILEQERFERLHMVTDNPDPEYLSWFARYDPIVVSSGPVGDWDYLRSFDRIVCSNSSFCWWAAFFSKASRIYTFKRWIPAWNVQMGKFPNGVEVDGPFLCET